MVTKPAQMPKPAPVWIGLKANSPVPIMIIKCETVELASPSNMPILQLRKNLFSTLTENFTLSINTAVAIVIAIHAFMAQIAIRANVVSESTHNCGWN